MPRPSRPLPPFATDRVNRSGARQPPICYTRAMPPLPPFALLAAPLLLVLAGPAAAQAPPTDVVTLSAAQREAALEDGATRSARELPLNGIGRTQIHGEVGMEIGTNGERAVYGTAIVPLGDTGSAAISFFDGRSGRWRQR